MINPDRRGDANEYSAERRYSQLEIVQKKQDPDHFLFYEDFLHLVATLRMDLDSSLFHNLYEACAPVPWTPAIKDRRFEHEALDNFITRIILEVSNVFYSYYGSEIITPTIVKQLLDKLGISSTAEALDLGANLYAYNYLAGTRITVGDFLNEVFDGIQVEGLEVTSVPSPNA